MLESETESALQNPKPPHTFKRTAPLYDQQQVKKFRETKRHHFQIWIEWATMSGFALFAGAFWAASAWIRQADHSGSTEEDVFYRLLETKSVAISLDLTSKIIAILATLVVAVSVIVRTFGTGDSVGIDWARRRALIVAARSLAVVAVFTATVSAVWNAPSDEWGLPAALGLIFSSLIIALISADAIRVFEQAKSSHPGYDAWRRDLQIGQLMRHLRRLRLTVNGSATKGLVFSPTHRARSSAWARTTFSAVVVGISFGLVFTIWGAELSSEEFDMDRYFRAFLGLTSAWALGYALFLYLLTFSLVYLLTGERGIAAVVILGTIGLALALTSGVMSSAAVPGRPTERTIWLSTATAMTAVIAILVIILNSRKKPLRPMARMLLGDTRTIVNSAILRRVRELRRQEQKLRMQIESEA